MTPSDKFSPEKIQAYLNKLVQGVIPKRQPKCDVSASSSEEASRMRLKKLSTRNTGEHNHPAHTNSSAPLLDAGKTGDSQSTRSGLSYWRLGVQQLSLPPIPQVKKTTGTWRFQFEENPFYNELRDKGEEKPEEVDLTPHAVLDPNAQPDLSESARREVLRIALLKRGQIARTLALATPGEAQPGDPEPETTLANHWNISGANSLQAIPSNDRLEAPKPAPEPIPQPAPAPPAGGDAQRTLQLPVATVIGQAQPAVNEATPLKTVPLSSASSSANHDRIGPKPEKPAHRLPNHQVKDTNPFKDYSDTALMLMAQGAGTNAETLFWLSGHHNVDIRCAVARNAKCPLEALSILAKDPEAGIRHSIAENAGSSLHILKMLAEDRNPLVAWRAQNNINSKRQGRTTTTIRVNQPAAKPEAARITRTDHPILPVSEDLTASEETLAFLRLIALKTNTPPRRLSELARHPDATVRAAVAENANTPQEMLWILARDCDQEVKIKVTDNYNCPTEILEALKEDADSYVAWQARNVLHRLTSANYPSTSSFEERSSGGGRAITRP